MTNEEIITAIDESIADFVDELYYLKTTTVGYKNKNWKPPPPAGTAWSNALVSRDAGLVKLEDLKTKLANVPPPPPPPTTVARRFNRAASNYSDSHAADHAERYVLTSMMGFNGPKYNTQIMLAGGKPLIYKDAMMLGIQTPLGSALNSNYAVQRTEGPASWDLGLAFNQARMGDIGNIDFQKKWAANAIAAAKAGGFAGVFIDDVRWKYGTYPSKYPSQQAWAAAMESFIKAVGALIKAAGLLVILNIGSSSDTVFRPILPVWLTYVDGYMEEGTGRATVEHSGPVNTGARVENEIANIQKCQSMGKFFMGNIPADDNDFTTQTYGCAIFLCALDSELASVGIAGSVEADGSHFGHEAWTSVCDKVIALGNPIQALQGNLANGYSRKFEHGNVSLNATAGTASINLT